VYPEQATAAERARWANTMANLPLLERASGGTVEEIISSSIFERHDPNARLFDEHEPASFAWVLLEGTVRVYQGDDQGGEYTPKIFSAPTHFGDLSAIAGLDTYRSSVEALTRCVTAKIPMPVIHEALESDHRLCLSWLKSVARQHSVTIDSDRQNVFGGLKSRVANVLLSYAEIFGIDERGLTGIDHPLSYGKLARHVGCTRRGAIKVMQQLEKSSVVRMTSDGWCIDKLRMQASLLPGRLSLASSLSRKK
jgi:CRP-like cAMP-binding protein